VSRRQTPRHSRSTHPQCLHELFYPDGGANGAVTEAAWDDVPTPVHNSGGGLSFADGHSEVHKWKDANTIFPPSKYVGSAGASCRGYGLGTAQQ
jgi:prepilin-type processing-associated H-X9-DG protein